MSMTLAGLPVVAFVLFAVGFVRHGSGGRTALLHAGTIWGVLVAVITEGLSVAGYLSQEALAVTWFAVDVALAALIAWKRSAQVTNITGRLHACRGSLSLVDAVLMAGVGVVVILVGVVALVSPPNSWDAMQYHLPRVVRWIQNRSVGFYPTHELKQLHMAPGAEYAVLQFHALWGGDRLDNLIQWFAMLGSVVGTSALARSLGASVRGQVLAAVVCVTIPEGILSASGAKNDYVLSFWLVALAFYVLRFQQNSVAPNAAGIGASLGLAFLTKGTAYALGPPILVTYWLFWSWRTKAALLKHGVLVIVVVLGLNGAQFARNQGLYGSPLGPVSEDPRGYFKYTNDHISIPAVLSNVVRNVVVHVRSEHRVTNAAVEGWVRSVLSWVGSDPSDPGANFFGPFRLPERAVREGYAGNPAHLALGLVVIGAALVMGVRRDGTTVATYAVALCAAFLMFCALLKWQPSVARLHLPMFVLMAPLTGAVIASVGRGSVGLIAAAAMFVLAQPALLENDARALALGRPFSILEKNRSHLYFGDRHDVARDYMAAVALVKGTGCGDVGLDLSREVGAQYEYALLAQLDSAGSRRTRAVGVTNASSRYGRARDAVELPCIVVCVRCGSLESTSNGYARNGISERRFGDVAVYAVHRTPH